MIGQVSSGTINFPLHNLPTYGVFYGGWIVPSGKLTVSYGKSASLMRKSTISMGHGFQFANCEKLPEVQGCFLSPIQVRAAVARTSWSWCRPPTSAPVCRCRGPRTTHRCTMAWSATPRAVTARRTPRRPRTSDGEVEMDVEVEGFYCEVVIFW